MPSTSDPSPKDAAQAALDRMTAMAGGQTSNPGEQAAPGGETSDEPTARQWSDEETQRAQTYLRRFGVPDDFASGENRDKAYELGLHLEKMQLGISEKSKAKDARISQLEAQLVELAAGARKAPRGGATTDEDPRKESIKLIAEELGVEASKIGPALERLIASHIPKAEAGPKTDPNLESTVMELAIESARTQVVGEFPALQPDTPLYGEVLETMQSLKGPRYDAMPLGQREVTRMRDAATLVLGPSGAGGGSKQTPARSPGSSVPRPGGRSDAKPSQLSPLEAAQAALARHGLQ